MRLKGSLIFSEGDVHGIGDDLGAVIRECAERFVKFEPIPHEATVDPLGRRHSAIADHLVEKCDGNADVGGRLRARETARETGQQ